MLLYHTKSFNSIFNPRNMQPAKPYASTHHPSIKSTPGNAHPAKSRLEFLARALLFTRTFKEDYPEELIMRIIHHYPSSEVKSFFQNELYLTDVLLSSDNQNPKAGEAFRMVVERNINSREELFEYRKAILKIVHEPINYHYPPPLYILPEETTPQTLRLLNQLHEFTPLGVLHFSKPLTIGYLLYNLYFGFRDRNNPDIIRVMQNISLKDPEGTRFFLKEEIQSIARSIAECTRTKSSSRISKVLQYKDFLEENYIFQHDGLSDNSLHDLF